MNFNNKLDTILEVFDVVHTGDDMDDITIKKNGSDIIYAFHDKKVQLSYFVKIGFNNLMGLQNTYPGKIFNLIKNKRYPGIITSKCYFITLVATEYHKNKDYSDYEDSDSLKHDLTGANNASFVYNKMLSCFLNFVSKYGWPAMIYYSAYDSRTISIYSKLLNMIARKKGFKYIPIGNDFYLLEDVANAISMDAERSGIDISALSAYARGFLDMEIKNQRLNRTQDEF